MSIKKNKDSHIDTTNILYIRITYRTTNHNIVNKSSTIYINSSTYNRIKTYIRIYYIKSNHRLSLFHNVKHYLPKYHNNTNTSIKYISYISDTLLNSCFCCNYCCFIGYFSNNLYYSGAGESKTVVLNS